VHSDQGSGDDIQFVRFLGALAKRAERVTLAVPRDLMPLFCWPTFRCRDLVVTDLGGDLPEADFHSAMCSYPRYLDLELPPSKFRPYIAAERAALAKSPGTELTIGLVWAPRPLAEVSARRIAPLGELLEPAAIPGVALYSLQVGPAAGDIERHGAGVLVVDLSRRLRDWGDTAQYMAALDLIVSVDSAPCILAGAMGRPCIGLLPYVPCWRWGLGTDRTPWYGTMRLLWLNTTGTFGSTDDALLTRLITAASVFLKNWLSRDIVLTNYTELRDGLGSPSTTFTFANYPVTAVYAVNVASVNIPPIPQGSGTLTTSAPTVAGDPTLNFTRVPSWVVQGLTITYPTTAGAVPSSTTVESTTATTVVMSQEVAGSGVASGDLIVFGPATGGVAIPQISSFYPPAGYINTPTKLVIFGYYVPRQPLCVSLIYQAGYATVPQDIAQACIELVALRYRLERQHPGVTADHIGTAAGDGVTYSQKDMNAWMRTTLQQYRAVAPVSAIQRGF